MGNSIATLAVILVLIGGNLHAKSPIPEVRPVNEYREEFASSVFLKNIFKTQTIVPEKVSDFGRNYVLDGVVEGGENGVIAFIRDPEKGVIIAKSRGESELRVVDAVLSDLPQDTKITISNGIDRVTLKYGEAKVAPKARSSEIGRGNEIEKSRNPVLPLQGLQPNRQNEVFMAGPGKGQRGLEEEWKRGEQEESVSEMRDRQARGRLEEAMKREVNVKSESEKKQDEQRRIEEMREREARGRLEEARKRESGESFGDGRINSPENFLPPPPRNRVVLPTVEEK